MRNLYRYLAMAVGAGVVIQAAAIAWGVFGLTSDVDDGVVVDKNYEGNPGFAIHSILGWMVLPLLALVLLGVAFALREVDGALRWAAIILGLVVLQVVLAVVSFAAPVVGVLHGINALALLGASFKAVYVVPRAISA